MYIIEQMQRKILNIIDFASVSIRIGIENQYKVSVVLNELVQN